MNTKWQQFINAKPISNSNSPIDTLLYQPNVTKLFQYGLLKVSGTDATPFLQGQLTCDVSAIQNNAGTLGGVCNRKGRVIAIFQLFYFASDYYFVLPKPQITFFQQHLMKYAIFSKVTISPLDDWIILGVTGNAQHFEDLSLPRTPHTIMHHDHILYFRLPGNPHRYLLMTDQADSAIALWQRLSHVNEIHESAWQYLSIWLGQAWIYPATQSLFTPQMLDLDKLGAVSFTKGCYVGQEIIARTQHLGKLKRHLYRAMITTSITPQPGESLCTTQEGTIGTVLEATSGLDNATLLLAVIEDRVINNETPIQYKDFELMQIQRATDTHE